MMGGILLAMDFSWVLTSSCESAWKCEKQKNVFKDHTSSYMESRFWKDTLGGKETS